MADEVFARAIDAMTDVQRRSVEAASALVERLVASVDGRQPSNDVDSDEALGGTPPSPTDDAIAAFARLWRESIMSLAGAMPGGATSPALDVSRTGPAATVRIALDPATRRGATEVWVHNPSGDAFDKLRVHCGALLANDGSSLGPEAVTVDPESFDLPARASRGVELSVDAGDARAGVYRALVLVDGVDDQWMPVEVVVAEPAE